LQVPGDFTWIAGNDYKKAYGDFRQYLDEFVYRKIWTELSSGDRRVCYGIAASKSGKVGEIRETLEDDSNYVNQYRERLI